VSLAPPAGRMSPDPCALRFPYVKLSFFFFFLLDSRSKRGTVVIVGVSDDATDSSTTRRRGLQRNSHVEVAATSYVASIISIHACFGTDPVGIQVTRHSTKTHLMQKALDFVLFQARGFQNKRSGHLKVCD
jgi:hypothetical protein